MSEISDSLGSFGLDGDEKKKYDENLPRYTCPECGTVMPENMHKCPKCGIVRMYLMSMPYHCRHCHCQYNYYKGGDRSKMYCWCCGAVFKQSDIDDLILKGLNVECE